MVANFDYETAIEKAKSKLKINDILQMIMDGEISNVAEIDGFMYINYSRVINEAFKYRHCLVANQVDRNLEVIMITGSSGSGKTTLAKAVILDDLRPSVMALSDLLKVTDKHIYSTLYVRYHNI